MPRKHTTAQVASDEEISVLLKNKIVAMIGKTKDVSTVTALTNAYAKLRAVELKMDEGSWGEDLPTAEPMPRVDLEGARQ